VSAEICHQSCQVSPPCQQPRMLGVCMSLSCRHSRVSAGYVSRQHAICPYSSVGELCPQDTVQHSSPQQGQPCRHPARIVIVMPGGRRSPASCARVLRHTACTRPPNGGWLYKAFPLSRGGCTLCILGAPPAAMQLLLSHTSCALASSLPRCQCSLCCDTYCTVC
jgi:hypothetical protein